MRSRSSAATMPRVSRLRRTCKDNTSDRSNSASLLAALAYPAAAACSKEDFRPQTRTSIPSPRPPCATNCPMAPRPKMPSVDPRSRCDSVQGHSPRFMRSASSATLRRDATINASASSAGATGELLLPVATAIPSSVQVDHLGIAANERDELELRQPFEQRAGKFDALAYRDDDVGIAKAFDELGQIARRLTIAYDVVMADQRKTLELIDHVLIVIGNDDFHEAHPPHDSCGR